MMVISRAIGGTLLTHALMLCAALTVAGPVTARGTSQEEATALRERLAGQAAALEEQVIAWRRDLHQHPELGNREFRTSRIVAEHLERVGLDEVRTGIAHTGVVGLLQGGKPGPTVALRADMDALPVTEAVDLPFASKVRATYNGQEVGVMHACGHDVHTAVLMGAAQVLAEMRDDLPGKVMFIFQPAEEGPPEGEEGGAALMLEEGIFEPPPAAIFGLHTWPIPAGRLAYRPGGMMAGADHLHVTVRGTQTHGAMPWDGIDPIVVASQIVLGLQTIASRQLDSRSPTIITIGTIHGGVRHNIIPDQVEMTGTIRILDPENRRNVLDRIRRTAERIAESAGAVATVEFDPYGPVTFNDPELTRRMVPTLERVAGPGMAEEIPPVMPSEDFSYYQQQVPGLYFFLGIGDPDLGPGEIAPNHSPHFAVDEDAILVGVRAMASVALDYLLLESAGNP
jgi:amidohydrolase